MQAIEEFKVGEYTVKIFPDPDFQLFDSKYSLSDKETQMIENGETYGFVIFDPEGNEVDACWNFVGFDHCKEYATDAANALPAPVFDICALSFSAAKYFEACKASKLPYTDALNALQAAQTDEIENFAAKCERYAYKTESESPANCPKCGHSWIEYGIGQFDTNDVDVVCECGKCGHVWRENYIFSHIIK